MSKAKHAGRRQVPAREFHTVHPSYKAVGASELAPVARNPAKLITTVPPDPWAWRGIYGKQKDETPEDIASTRASV